MNKALVLTLALAAATTSASVVATRPATADDSMAAMDCTQADAMMSKAESKAPPAMTGNADKDFMLIVMDNESKSMTIMNIEAQCGKDPKLKKAAKTQGITQKERMNVFRKMGTSD